MGRVLPAGRPCRLNPFDPLEGTETPEPSNTAQMNGASIPSTRLRVLKPRWPAARAGKTTSLNPFDPLEGTETQPTGTRCRKLSRLNPFDPLEGTETRFDVSGQRVER